MSGHSKWSKVKHQKAVTDVVKAAAFTKASHAITIAVREGGGVDDPNFNFKLRLAVEKARAVNMPKENIDRAIIKGKGEGGTEIYSAMYEAYGPGGTAILIEATTDNKQRTVSAIKNILERNGGRLVDPGAVLYLFTQVGILVVPKNNLSYDTLLEDSLDAGADDISVTEDMYEIFCASNNLTIVKNKLEEKGITVDNTDIIMKPHITTNAIEALDRLIELLENLDDVQRVYSNAN
jgi:YebC/PmpR family DNA-binding regulatory protein